MHLLARRLDAMGSSQRIVLFPQTFDFRPCPDACDGALEELQHGYLMLALTEPRVVGMVNFGFWVDPAANTLALPLTAQLMRWIGGTLLGL